IGLGIAAAGVSLSVTVAADRRFPPPGTASGLGTAAGESAIEQILFGDEDQHRLLPARSDAAAEIPAVPQEIVATGRRRVPGSVVWAIVVSDRLYVQVLPDLFGRRDRYRVRFSIGERGVAGTGALYRLAVAEVRGGKVVARSKFYLVKR